MPTYFSQPPPGDVMTTQPWQPQLGSPFDGRLDLRFRDAETERQFQREDFGRWILFTRASLLLGLLIHAVSALIVSHVAVEKVAHLLTLRLVVETPILVLIVGSTFTRYYARIEQVVLTAVPAIAGGAILAMTWAIDPPGNYLYGLGIGVILFYCATLTRIHYLNLAAVGVALALADQYVLLVANPVPTGPLIAEETYLLVALLVSVFGLYQREVYTRRNFMTQQLLRQETARANALVVEAQSANRAKSEFIANISHELRTPLNAVIGFSDMIRADRAARLGMDKCREYAEDIHQSGEHLLGIINNILDLSKIEAGKHVLDETVFAPEEPVEMAWLLVRSRAEEAGIKLDHALAPGRVRLRADKRAVEQMLINLLANAVKFTPSGGIHLAGAREPDGGYRFTVSDTGIGMSAADIKVALTPFGTVEGALSRKQHGTGLGLPIVASLAKLHGATLAI